MTGRLRPALVFAREGSCEQLSLEKAEEIGNERLIAALFMDLARREGVVRAFRQGERRVEVDGRGRRALGVLEYEVESGKWWLAFRLIGTGEASVGVFHGEWKESEGEGLEALDEDFREWLDAGTATIETRREELTASAGEDIRCATAPWGELPPDVLSVAIHLAQTFFPELLQQPLNYLLVLVYRPGSLDRWELRGKLSLPIDDMIRGIAAQGPTEAVALVTPNVVELGGVNQRCYRLLVERGGHVGELILPLSTKDGALQGGEMKYRDAGPVPAGGMWIGVKPEREVNLTAMGPVDGGEIPEG